MSDILVLWLDRWPCGEPLQFAFQTIYQPVPVDPPPRYRIELDLEAMTASVRLATPEELAAFPKSPTS